MVDYGNARVAARRGRLLDDETMRHLGEAGSPSAMLVQLERFDDWRATLRELGPLATRPRAAIELAIERHRSERLGTLPRLYDLPWRGLVEALVMPLDVERLLEVLRRRRLGEGSEAVSETVSRGALLDERAVAALARAPSAGDAVRLLGRLGIVARKRAMAVARAFERDADWGALEAGLLDAIAAARDARVAGASADAALVRTIVGAERDDRAAVAAELATEGAAGAADLERQRTLARLDGLTARAHRDPLGIGIVAGYVAAVEAQAIRLRAVLARVADGWSRERAGAWLAAGRA
jgi:vacuolar-type H+-ATPase subunit C/Vma6